MFKKKKLPDIYINKKTHLLVLDHRWHELFKDSKTKRMSELEKKLNHLIKKQGQYNNDLKEYSNLKKRIMSEIVHNMDAIQENASSKDTQMDKNKNYINEINKKIEKLQQRVYDLPEEINQVNQELLNISMAECYKKIFRNKKNLTKMDDEIIQLRDQLKELIIDRDETKEEYDQLYSYMHDLVGPEIIEQFDGLYLKP